MKRVNSFDIFDTLIARNCREPSDLFEMIEKELPYKHFKALRIEAERIASYKNGMYMNFDHIYDEYLELDHEADIDRLKRAELDYEYENSIPIVANIQKIKPGDIYISDMYLKKEQIFRLLKKHNIPIDHDLYVTNGGKHSGKIYEELVRSYRIGLHTGDNAYSDILMAQKYRIPTSHTTVSLFTPTENLLYQRKLFDLQKSIRAFRLKNPYPEGSRLNNIYNVQAQYNIPILVLFCIQINEIMIKEKRTKILFVTRDCCLLIKMFKKFFPQYESIYFSSGRYIHRNPTPGYKEYVRQHYTSKCLMVDLHGSFQTGMSLYWELFGEVPRVHYLVYDKPKSLNAKLTACIFPEDTTLPYLYIETLNFDTQGTLFGMIEGVSLRIYNENDDVDLHASHKAFLDYLETVTYSIYTIHTNISEVIHAIMDPWKTTPPFWLGSSNDQPIH